MTTISRRKLLAGAAAAGGATAIGLAGQGLPAGAQETDDRRDFDVIIVGAGFAGITAARELRAKRKRVLVLEAKDRIGGRTWTDTWLGQQIERGGAWVDQKQPHIWRELVRYNIPLVADAGPEWVVLPTVDGFQQYDPVVAYTRQGELFTPFFDGSEEYFPRPFEPFAREDLVRPLDGFSLRDRLDQLNYPPEDLVRMTGTMALYGGGSERGAMTHLSQWWALAGWNYEGFLGINTFRPKDGTIALLGAMLADAAPTLRLRSPVASIRQVGARVLVTTRAGTRYIAPEVIMAVPVNAWRTITFAPKLPAAHLEASTQGIGVRYEKKLWLDLANPGERFIAEAPEEDRFPICIMGRLTDGQPTIAFSTKDNLNVDNRAEVEAAVKAVLPDAVLGDYTATNWGADEFTQGGAPFRQPFQLTRLHRAIQRPHGRVKFACSEIADGWSGFMDGAIEAGLRAVGSPTLSGAQAAAMAEAMAEAEGYEVPDVDRKVYRSMWRF